MGDIKPGTDEEIFINRIKVAVCALCAIWVVYFCLVNGFFNKIINSIAAIITVFTFFGVSFSLNKKNKKRNKANSKQDDNSQMVEKPIRNKSRRNCKLKWLFLTIVLVDMVSIGFLIIKSKNIFNQGNNHSKMQPQEHYWDSIAAANREIWFKKQVDEFDSILNQPLKLDNAQQVISQAYSVLCPLCDTLNKYPTMSSPKAFSDRYDSLVNEAVKVVSGAIYDVNLDSLERNKRKIIYSEQLKEIDQLRFYP